MKNMEEYRLKLEEYANNLVNKRQDQMHIIDEGALDFQIVSILNRIMREETEFLDAMGDEDLKNYEKWLDGLF